MRWSFLLLVVLNAIYACWSLQAKSPMPSLRKDFSSSEAGRLELLNERPSRSVLPERLKACLLLGGLVDPLVLEQLRQRLIALGITAESREESANSGVDYWVYLPPLTSRDAAIRQLKELQARALEGYLIVQGDLQGGVSLGVFSSQGQADERVAQLRSMGYSAQLKQLARGRSSFWLVVPSGERGLLGASALKSLLEDFSGLSTREAPCKEVAP